MVSWSGLGRSVGLSLLKSNTISPLTVKNVKFSTTNILKDDHGHKVFVLQPSRWQWHKFKDMFHLYFMVGAIPVAACIFYSNVYVGPATLCPIPENYTPQYWEYHRHPITRFLARYVYNNPQQDYEKQMHFMDEEKQMMKLRAVEKKVKSLMAERLDYKAYYYRPMVNKYLRINKQTGDELFDRLGDNFEE